MPHPGLNLMVAQAGIIGGLLLLLCGVVAVVLYCREAQWCGEHSDAEQRAHALLQRLLTAEEQDKLSAHGFLEVPSSLVPGRSYRVPRRRGQVQVYDQGHYSGSLCIQPTRWIPDSDLVLAHKLMIEGNEADFLRTANFFKPYRFN